MTQHTRRLRVLMALLFAGTIINVAVAWGWAAWGVPPHADAGSWSVSGEDSPFWLMQGQGGMGAQVVRAAPIHATGRSAMPFQRLASSRPDVPTYVRSRFNEPPEQEDRSIRYGFDERGWPLRCLRSEHAHRYDADGGSAIVRDVQVKAGIQLWPEASTRGGWALQRVRALPLAPIWPAFMLDSLLYAALAGAVCIGYPAMINVLSARRSIRLAIAAALIAAIMCLAVAFAVAAIYESPQMARITAVEPLPGGAAAAERPPQLAMDRQDRFGATRLIFSAGRGGIESDRLPRPPITGAAPWWSKTSVEGARQREWRSFEWRTVEAVGWPFRALRSSFDSRVIAGLTIEVDVARGIVIDDLPAGFEIDTARTLRVLPTRIIWPGLLANWAILAFALFGAIALPGAARRGWRMHRGRCAECGYDLRGEFAGCCPECSWKRRRPEPSQAGA